MLLDLRRAFPEIIADIRVVRFREDLGSYALIATLVLRDGSCVHVRDYLFPSGQRKYAYHWQTAGGKLIARWDNAAHWPNIGTYPSHVHEADKDRVRDSAVGDLHAALECIRDRLARQ